jgi:hypothetical protein
MTMLSQSVHLIVYSVDKRAEQHVMRKCWSNLKIDDIDII